MFERRLRLFLFIVFFLGLVLAVRAAQVQILDGDRWTTLAANNAEQVQFLPAKRGDLRDFKGRVIATDIPTFEVAVNFRAIVSEPELAWLNPEATRRARKLPGYADGDADARALLVAQELQSVRDDLEEMWNALAGLTGQTRTQLDAIRQGITADVDVKHESFWQRKYRDALAEYEKAPTPPWYVRWIAGTPEKPDPVEFEKNNSIYDQEAYHTIVADLTPAVYNELALMQDRFPQFRDSARRFHSVMQLRPSQRRSYPYKEVAAHVIGHVGNVSAEDREADPNKNDERRRYLLVDRIGRDGVEKLAEPQLRGALGQRVSDRGGTALELDTADAGQDVRTTIDIELQRDIQNAFREVVFQYPDKDAAGHPIREKLSMNGAAVIIDIPTGQVRALVSVPTYDVNQFDQLYEKLLDDELNGPLRNRALMDAVEAGSSVKPIVGLGAVTQKLIGAADTIHCEGYAIIDGKQIAKPRCWTLSQFKTTHQALGAKPHPTGDLTLADAIERSCNVYFVTLGNRLGIEGLSYWMRKFGFGEISGIGLPEARGLIPSMAKMRNSDRQSNAWYAAIGQGPMSATPIQVANEIATIARNGIWVRPRLLVDIAPPPTTRPSGELIPDRVDLGLDPAALKAVHEGMVNVVNSEAGTGRGIHRDDVVVAAKTGSASAVPLVRLLRGPDGSVLRDEDNRPRFEVIQYGSLNQPNPELPWYRLSGYDDQGRKKGTHSWVAGYAPAENPQIAFAVYVEYGGSGGIGAGSVANKLLDACIARGYVTKKAITPAAIDPLIPMRATPINTED